MFELIIRQEAISKGLKHYFTGKPCKRGHVDRRLVSNYGCLTCALEHERRYRKENPEKARAKWRRYDARNPERRRQISRYYRERNLEKERTRLRENMRKLREDPEKRQEIDERTKVYHRRRYAEDSEYRAEKLAKNKAWTDSERGKSLISARHKDRWANDPEYREKCRQSTMAWYNNPDRVEAVIKIQD